MVLKREGSEEVVKARVSEEGLENQVSPKNEMAVD